MLNNWWHLDNVIKLVVITYGLFFLGKNGERNERAEVNSFISVEFTLIM